MRLLDETIHRNAENTERIVENTLGYVISDNTTGTVAETSFDNTSAQALIKHLHGVLVSVAKSAVRDLDPSNELCFLRISTRKFEYLIAPEEIFTITVVQ